MGQERLVQKVEKWQIVRVKNELDKADVGYRAVGHYLPISGDEFEAEVKPHGLVSGRKVPNYLYKFEVELFSLWDVTLKADSNYGTYTFYFEPYRQAIPLANMVKEILGENDE
jgi:hypothetical protein